MISYAGEAAPNRVAGQLSFLAVHPTPNRCCKAELSKSKLTQESLSQYRRVSAVLMETRGVTTVFYCSACRQQAPRSACLSTDYYSASSGKSQNQPLGCADDRQKRTGAPT